MGLDSAKEGATNSASSPTVHVQHPEQDGEYGDEEARQEPREGFCVSFAELPSPERHHHRALPGTYVPVPSCWARYCSSPTWPMASIWLSSQSMCVSSSRIISSKRERVP